MDKINIKNIINNSEFVNLFGIDENTEFKILGQGEYNINYIFYSPVYSEKLVLRIATASQMGLENQIEYEYKALELLKNSNRTPKPIFYDASKYFIPFGYLVMEYLDGIALDYKGDLKIAARILADIHSVKISNDNILISPENPIKAIYEESISMFNKYRISPYVDIKIEKKIEFLLGKANSIEVKDIGNRTIINTELNSGNFLINGETKENYLVDWEKPLYAYPSQDLGHFLAPTTSFWKTDIILSKDEIMSFIEEYTKHSNQYNNSLELWDSVKRYLSINCLRGITWCSMAYAEYQNPEKLISNPYTYKKISSYLSEEFLDMLRDDYLNEY